jgi:hypothetical protein
MLAAALALGGCGNSRARPPDTATPELPRGTKQTDVDAAGVRFSSPANWPDLPPLGRRVGGVQSRTATVAVWRYPRSEPLPADRAALREVLGLLVDRVKRRDPTFELRAARLVRRGEAPGIEVLGRQTIAGRRFGVRSSHLFSRGAEVVIDAYAPAAQFGRLDRAVFRPLLRSVREIRVDRAR